MQECEDLAEPMTLTEEEVELEESRAVCPEGCEESEGCYMNTGASEHCMTCDRWFKSG